MIWNPVDIETLFGVPFNDLLFRAHTIHREHFDPNAVQRSTLMSIKTGGCSEDCSYCSQSARHDTGVDRGALAALDEVVEAARAARESGATRFCMGAAWRGPKERELDAVIPMIRAVKELGLEACATLGFLKEGQAERLKAAGLDYYNHNLDTSRARYGDIVTTHGYDDRLRTLRDVRDAGIKVCCGGIMGMGEARADRAAFLAELAALDPPPESVPINLLVRISGTPLAEPRAENAPTCGDAGTPALDPVEFVRTIACARIVMPRSMIRLSAGRAGMPDHLQALCFFAGANSIFYGERLLTTGNPDVSADEALFSKLGLTPLTAEAAQTTGSASCPESAIFGLAG